MDLEQYKAWYETEYKHQPSIKLIESFQKLHPSQDPTPEEFFNEPEPEIPKFKFIKV
jgi:hypothetical protein